MTQVIGPSDPAEGFSSCDKEPIHIPAAIQPHGILLAVDTSQLTIVHASANCEQWLHQVPASLVGRSLDDLLTAESVAALQECIDECAETSSSSRALRFAQENRDPLTFSAWAHRASNLVIIELEEHPISLGVDDQTLLTLMGKMRIANHQLGQCGKVEELCQAVTEELRALIGYDRVMVYQFNHEWDGVVLAEHRADSLEPYLGLHYPATDIPAPARAMFLQNRLRVIPDVQYQPAALLPQKHPSSGQPLDLSRAQLRSVSPIHLEYLRNMGVRATLTMSLLVDGRLWGLIACHHYCPRLPSPLLREVCELFAQLVSSRLSECVQAAGKMVAEQSKAAIRRLAERVEQFDSIAPALLFDENDLLALTSSQGAIIWRDGEAFPIGVTPPLDSIWNIQQWVKDTAKDPIFYTDCLSKCFPGAEAYADVASGMLTLALARSPDIFVLWFRSELIRIVDWAGDPNKSLDAARNDGHMHPRKSFAIWRESVRNRSLPWLQGEIEAVKQLQPILQGQLARNAEQLSRLLPICAWCKKVRSDEDYWQQVEAYVSQNTDIRFTHGVCPACFNKQIQAL